jgi:EAL domain-containing protein (putative c-di-GMP-specific phosphodiesterase class I)
MLEIQGVQLVPYWQPYTSIDPRAFPKGELLTRPQVARQTEEFFSDLDIDSQFAILEWQVALQHDLYAHTGSQVSINVHNRVVESDEGRARFLELVGSTTAPTTFEFTETYPMPPVTTSNRLLQAIRDLGHSSALDDFGTGLNGMSLLTGYDFDIIKLDRSLIFDLPSRVEKQKTLRLMLEMLQVLGKQHVVEGVETEEIFDILKGLGYTTFQGYLFGQPEPVETVLATTSKETSS